MLKRKNYVMLCGGIGFKTIFVQLENGTLDNVQIICPNFAHAILYTKNVDENNNPTDADGRYFSVPRA